MGVRHSGGFVSITTVTLDLDGTLLPDTTAFAEILSQYGHRDDVAASDARYFAGDINLRECFMEQWDWFQKLTPADIHRALRDAPWISDVREAVAEMRAAGLKVRMLTDQPSTITDFGSRWGLGPAISSPVTVKDGQQILLDFQEEKKANLRASGLDPTSVIHVGNGTNDVPVWNAGAKGIAVFADPPVAAHATRDLGRPVSLHAVAQVAIEMADNS